MNQHHRHRWPWRGIALCCALSLLVSCSGAQSDSAAARVEPTLDATDDGSADTTAADETPSSDAPSDERVADPAPTAEPTKADDTVTPFPPELASDLANLQRAIDIRFYQDMATCLRGKGQTTGVYDRQIADTYASGDSPAGPTEDGLFMFDLFIESVEAEDDPSKAAEYNEFSSPAYTKADQECFKASKFNVTGPNLDDWSSAATELFVADPRLIAATEKREGCLVQGGVNLGEVADQQLNDLSNLTYAYFEQGNLSTGRTIEAAREMREKYRVAAEATEPCLQEYDATVLPIHDEYFREVALESPDYERVVSELKAFIEPYRDILDELE